MLDELLDARVLIDRARLERVARRARAHARASTRATPSARWTRCRHFQHAQSFRLLAQDLAGRSPSSGSPTTCPRSPTSCSRRRSTCVWRQLAGRGRAAAPRFAIIGYGKLGGKELGYASDLDLVFVFDDDADDRRASSRATRASRSA